MKVAIKRICRADEGVTAIEYALLAALIAVVIAISVGTVGTQVVLLYTDIKDKVVLATQ